MAASVSVLVEPVSVQIQSGGRASARITLLNKGDAVGQYVLEVKGLDPAWYKLDTNQAGVFPGDRAAFQLSIRPPADAVSATYQVTLFAHSQEEASDQAQAVLSLTVQRLGEVTPGEPVHPLQAGASSAAQPTVLSPGAPISGLISAGQVQPTQPRPYEPVRGAPVGPPPQPGPRTAAAPTGPVSFGQAVLRAASLSGQLLLNADREGFKLPAGATSALNLGLSNTGGAGINLELVVKGPPLSWVSLSPASLSLAPGETAYSMLSLSIPAQTPIGNYPLAVLAQSAEDASLNTRLNMMLEVTRPGEINLELSPIQAQGETGAEYVLQASQSGQSPLSVNLSARDESGVLDFTFSPAALTLPVDGKASSRLTVRSRQVVSGSDSLTYPFSISGLPSGGGAAAVSVSGRFVQLRPAPLKLLIQPDEIRDPGQASYQIRMDNPGATLLSYRLSATDPDNSCDFQFESRVLNVPANGEASTVLHVTPPSYLSGGEVIHTLRVSAQPSSGPGSPLIAEVRFIQTAGQPPALSITPASQTSAGPAVYTVTVVNPRPVPLQIELRAYDAGQLCQFTLEPASMNIPAMYQATARLDVNPVADLLAGESKRICAFSVAGYIDNQPAPILAEGTLLQVPGFTWRKLLPLFIAAIILLGVGAVVILALLYTQFVH